MYPPKKNPAGTEPSPLNDKKNKQNRGLSIKIENCWRQNFEISNIHKASCEVKYTKFGPDRFSRLLDKSRQTDKKSIYMMNCLRSRASKNGLEQA